MSRELTKLHLGTVRGTITKVLTYFTAKPPKGEFITVVWGKK